MRPRVTAMVKPGVKLLGVTSETASTCPIAMTLLAADHPVNRYTRRVNVFIGELRAKHRKFEVADLNHISPRLLTSNSMHLRMPGKRHFAKLIIEALLGINITVCDPSSAIMASPADKPQSTTGPVAAAELHHGAKSSSDTTGPSDDAEPVAAAVPQQDAGLSSAAGPPSATEPHDDPPVPAELHRKPSAAGLINVVGQISFGELSSVFGPPFENVPRVCHGTDS
ncbi:hypothetical protein J6590_003379 [Homalodisca vitripennis]|nr:hypothetical protein J6590_003379 [Homalodisca vitripennis]